MHVRFPVSGEDVEPVVLLDFAGYFGFYRVLCLAKVGSLTSF
jgi:hypothetical protein